ncbi:MAG: glycosyltransferase [Snowella sp.]|nr:glycosyltransferase [Snowella sp.]
MILVTVGTEKYPFNRLMLWIDLLLKYGFLDSEKEEILVQYGTCSILPTGVKIYKLLPEAEFSRLLTKARLVIAHCGEGTMDVLTELEKPFVLVPRQHRFGEHLDDHQMELAEVLKDLGFAIAYSPGDLARFLFAPQSSPMIHLGEMLSKNLCQKLNNRFPTL